VVRKSLKRGLRVSRYIVYKETLVDTKEHIWSFLGAFVGIGLIAFCQTQMLNKIENVFLIGSFGASSVLVYGSIQSPLAQPRNLIGGHVVSALIGVSVYHLVPDIIWINAPLAVSLSIVAMQITKTLHPPGGATALIAVIGSEKIKTLGFLYVISPVLSGSLILLVVALIFNNITSERKYPTDKRFTNYIRKNFKGSRIFRNRVIEVDPATISWIFLATHMGSKFKPASFGQISIAAVDINHYVPTQKQMQSSLSQLRSMELIEKRSKKYLLTAKGKQLLEEASSEQSLPKEILKKLQTLIKL
jgi:CBS domain-containing membrane protein